MARVPLELPPGKSLVAAYVVLCLALGVFSVSCARDAGSRSASAEPGRASAASDEFALPADARGVAVAQVKSKRLPDYLEISARIEADPTGVVRVYAPVSGRLISVNVRPSDIVAGGQPLAVVASSDVAAAREAYEQALSVDLVVSTAWLRQPVAILLNDGHGEFTPAKPAAFPDAFQRSASERFSSHHRHAGPIGALTPSRLTVCMGTPLSHPLSATRFRSPFTSAIFLPSYVLSNRGRDPPIRSQIRTSRSDFPSGKQLTQTTCRSVPFRECSRDRTHKHYGYGSLRNEMWSVSRCVSS